MDISDCTRIVFDKIQKFEPENATKIIGYLLLQDNGEQEMAQLASCPDHVIREVVFKAKTGLQMLASRSTILPISPPVNPQQQGLSSFPVISPRTPSLPPSFLVPSPYWDSQPATNANSEFMAMNYFDSLAELQKQAQLLSLENHLDPINTGTARIANDFYGLDVSAPNFGGKAGRRFSNLSEFQVKTCHYFSKGYCKHGTSCRYYHGPVVPESFPQMRKNVSANEDEVFSPVSLAQLEAEIVELLKPRKGNPISIATLPMVYYDKYKKVLQADGYLTESQRHGKSGYSLTKLLARLKNSIHIIDRPHGQHEVVLIEDAPKRPRKGDYVQNISASRQIYLTFPADSTFSEEDVSEYFSTFGCVEDVRIPCQQRRMFGFVTFADPETVKTILDKGNPHYVSGSRVLVKPYREKSKVIERKYADRIEHPVCYSPHFLDMDSEIPSIPRSCGNPRLRRQLIEKQQQAMELQRRHLAELQFSQKTLATSPSPNFGFPMGGLRVSDDHFNFQPEECFGYALNDKLRPIDTNHSDENSSQGFDLPDSPFAFLTESGNQRE